MQEQAALSSHYAQRGGHAALEEHFIVGPSGEPQLIDAHVHFTCATHATYPGGDHQIILGEVLDMTLRDASPSHLLWWRLSEASAETRLHPVHKLSVINLSCLP